MDFYVLETTGDLNDSSLALVEDAPQGMALRDYCLVQGLKAQSYYPEDAKVFLRSQRAGLKLAGILGNLNGFLIASRKAREIIEAHCPDRDIEFLPFTLYNQKKRVHSTDYCFVNPIGGFDCLNEPECGIQFDSDGEIVVMEKIVLDANKIAEAPELFRIHKAPTNYVVSRRLAQALKDNGVTNVLGKKLRVQ